MSSLFPEFPILFYPSLARQLGTDEALLLAIYHQYGQHHGVIDDDDTCGFVVSRREWLKLADFWDENQVASVTGSLVAQGVLEAEMQANRSLRIRLQASRAIGAAASPAPSASKSESEVAELRVSAVTSEYAPHRSEVARNELDCRPNLERDILSGNTLQDRGPAPCFGGSTGWRRPKDELEALFEQQEARNRQLQSMSIDWQPGDTTWQLLGKQLVPEAFARERIEEFIAYWIDKNRREASWDHLFIRLVTREWAKAQGRQGRSGPQSNAEGEAKSERYQADNRAQRRERITDAVMDIHNTDW